MIKITMNLIKSFALFKTIIRETAQTLSLTRI